MSHRHKPHSGSSSHANPQPALPADEVQGHTISAEHRAGLLPEKHFRWRGGEMTRLEAFSDVVFGFALTLLVVSLEVPRNYEELMTAMRGFVPFAACFAQLVMIWRAHYIFSRRFGLQDSYTVFLNVMLLFVVLFYVYPLKFVFTFVLMQFMGAVPPGTLNDGQASVLMRVYAVGFAAVFILFVLMYTHAYKLRRELGLSPVETLETRKTAQEHALLAAIAGLSFFIALRRPDWAGWAYVLIAPMLTVHGSIFGKRVRLLAEK